MAERKGRPQGLLLAEHLSGPSSVRAFLHLLSRAYGDNEATLRSKLLRLQSLCALFLELYGDGPAALLRAPARINILGEHVDYVSYLPTASLPFGSREHDMLMLYRPVETLLVRGASTIDKFTPFSYNLGDGPATDGTDHAGDWLSHLYRTSPPTPHWGNYVKGAGYFARLKYGGRVARGYDFVVDSSIPASGGASSSSALVVLAGAAVRKVNAIELSAAELANDSSLAEWYVGTRGGSMDHLTICLAERSHAVLISYREQQTISLPLPDKRFRWVTFFSHPADKGREIMLEYNERAAVSRVLIPAIIEGWRYGDSVRHAAWVRALESVLSGRHDALGEIESILGELPETVELSQVKQSYPDAFAEFVLAFPALVAGERERPLRVRAYALHHLGEVRRVAAARRLLDAEAHAGDSPPERDGADVISSLGRLLDESHASLRDLYGVSTPDVERLIEIIHSDPHVGGARLMGGGFGGNVLALIDEENVHALVERVQAKFYAPRSRDDARDISVMISTPGDGVSPLNLEAVWREAVEQFNALGHQSADHRSRFAEMLDGVETETGEVWPVIVAAGKGSRARESGLSAPKPLAKVAGVPAVLHVLRGIRSVIKKMRPPVIIVSPETEAEMRETLAGEDVLFVVQDEALGTGDAVWRTRALMKDFAGRVLVAWGTQPVIRSATIKGALKLAALFDEYAMILPTALKDRPYAPLERDRRGRVVASRETHLESAPRPAFGETNIGLFVLKAREMFGALAELRRQFWREAVRRYERPGGELGFPNEMINHLASRESGIMACPLADAREEQGIKTLKDVAHCEQFLVELRDVKF